MSVATVAVVPGLRLVDDLLERACSLWPGALAVVTEDRQWTFAELHARAASVGEGLRRAGVRRGGRVVVAVDDPLEAAAAIFATMRLGAAFVPADNTLGSYGADHVLRDASPSCVVVSGGRAFAAGATSAGIPVLEISAGAAYPSPDGDGAPPNISHDLACVIYTSGSTGRPKGVMSTHANVLFALHAIASRVPVTNDDTIGCLLPLHFDYGLYQIFLGLLCGATVAFGHGTAAGPRLLSFLVEHGVSVLPIVPGLGHILVQLCRRSPTCRPALRIITNTGAAMNRQLIGELQALYPETGLYSMFGLTECKRVSILTSEELPAKPGSVGRPLDDTECLVVDHEGRALPPGRPGELVVRGAHVMQGYWNDEQASLERFRPWGAARERVLFTGDRCVIDGDGYLYFIGRDDDVYKSDGFRVSAVEVALAAEDIPGVTQAFCVPPTTGQGALLAAVATITVREIRAELSARLEPYKLPARIVVLDELPLKSNGKVDARALVDRLPQEERRPGPAGGTTP